MTGDNTDFLYPMIEGDDVDGEALLDDLASSAADKAAISTSLTSTTLVALQDTLDVVAAAMAQRFTTGGRLFTFGNGGSATDAEGVAALFTHPSDGSQSLPARSLVADVSILTALSNDIGFDVVFARQLIAHGTDRDIALGFSTSGNSDNVVKAFIEADARGLLTVGLAGNDGGAMGACDQLAHCLVVASDSVHRIQEAQSAVAYELWRRIHAELPERSPLTTGVPR